MSFAPTDRIAPPTRENLPWRRVALWGFGLNTVWEFVQCTILYDMWDWGFWRITAWMWGAIAGDVVIVLGVAWLAARFVSVHRLAPPTGAGWIALVGVGFVAAVLLEWAAQVLNLWGYSELMPTITIASHTVGLSPVVQITLLPAFSVYLASRVRHRSI